MPHTRSLPTWLHSERFLARNLGRPVLRFLHIEAAGGLVLLASTAFALVWANSAWAASYDAVWSTEVVLRIGGHVWSEDLHHWINDGLMAVFFFVVGLEIKQELTTGHLSRARDAVLPAIAALGGMAVPAVIFAVLNRSGDGSRGWGIPMATDIAFALGVLALFGDRAPTPLKILLLALAIVDDIGAIVVIALFYSDDLQAQWLLAAFGGMAVIVAMRRLRIWYTPAYVVIGTGLWLATFESGVHATIAGVALGLLCPAQPLLDDTQAAAIADELSADTAVTVSEVRSVTVRLKESVSVAERLQDLLHPWTSFVVIPLFALANAGIAVSTDAVIDATRSPVTAGVIIGLVAGKFIGITGAIYVVTRLGLARLPGNVTMRQIGGIALLAGIGFTVSLFIAGLAYGDAALDAQAKIGILAASGLAGALGSATLHVVLPPRTST